MTEIHDQTYRRYRGSRERQAGAWSVITVQGIRSAVSRRTFVALLLFAWMPFVLVAFQFYAVANFPRFGLPAPSAETFRDFLTDQTFFVFFVTIYAGAGLIANDRRANALQIYLAKPLTRAEYIGGKLGVLAVLLIGVTWVPAMLLVVLQVLFAGSFAFVRSNLYILPAATLFAIVQVLLASCTMLALSSLSKSGRYAAVLYAGAVIFTDAMSEVLELVSGSTRFAWISLPAALEQLGDLVFRLPLRSEVPAALSVAVIAGVIGLSLLVLNRQIRGVEVVT